MKHTEDETISIIETVFGGITVLITAPLMLMIVLVVYALFIAVVFGIRILPL